MRWIEVTVHTNTAGADMVSEQLMIAGANGTAIEDRHDAQTDPQDAAKWDILDPALLDAMGEDVKVHGYLLDDASTVERIAAFRQVLATLTPERIGFDAGPLTVSLADRQDEDWSENWKRYYKPFRVGQHIVIKPVWESYDAADSLDRVIDIDPGMAFGNGTHETTSMCIELIEKTLRPGDTVIDIGTGSGILAMVAALCGASEVLAIDMDSCAVRVAQENIARNGLQDIITTKTGDLLHGTESRATYVVANIIADVIIQLIPSAHSRLLPDGVLLCSGIIRDREAEVINALEASSFHVDTVERQGEWVAIVARS